MDLEEYNNEMARYRIIEHTLRDKSVFVVEWNDRWFFGRWHERFHCFKLEEAIEKIQRLIKIKNK
jgi:hypothetical protein